MAHRRYPPGFFDIPQDMSRQLPVGLIQAWLSSDGSEAAAQELLAPSLVRGTIVSSDSSGLTKLSRELGLIEILALINKPKELVHAHGRAIGGEPVGIWAADNTQMFYPERVSARTIVEMLACLRADLEAECSVKLGIGAHFGEFYALGGGMYGPHADTIEELTENHVAGGMVVIADSLARRLGQAHPSLLSKAHSPHELLGDLFHLGDYTAPVAYDPIDTAYPIPYSSDFYAGLRAYQESPDPALLDTLTEKHTQEKTVVLIERNRDVFSSPEISLLSDLALTAATKKCISASISRHMGTEIKTAGNLSICVFDHPANAVAFAKEIRSLLLDARITSRIGIDTGSLLIFSITDGLSDIAGMPVNVASKMAQDKGAWGKIYATEQTARGADLNHFKKVSFEASGVTITAYEG